MTRSIIAAAALAFVASVSAVSAEQDNRVRDFSANPAAPAALSATAAAEVRQLVGNAAIDALTSAEVGAIEATLYSDESNKAAVIRAILAGDSDIAASRADTFALRSPGNDK